MDNSSKAVCILHRGLEAHFLLLEEVGLVAYDCYYGICWTVGLELFDPTLHYLEGVLGSDVEDADGDPCGLVIERGDGSVLFLACCVPEMELDGPSHGQGMHLGQVCSSKCGLLEGVELLIVEGLNDR